jgi:hypothetical protein
VVVVLHCSSCTLYCASLLLLVWRSAFLIKFADSKKKIIHMDTTMYLHWSFELLLESFRK